jgi:hypothetical protein
MGGAAAGARGKLAAVEAGVGRAWRGGLWRTHGRARTTAAGAGAFTSARAPARPRAAWRAAGVPVCRRLSLNRAPPGG